MPPPAVAFAKESLRSCDEKWSASKSKSSKHVATHAKVTSGTVGSFPGKSHHIGASRGKLTL